jgi:hypothetical protein
VESSFPYEGKVVLRNKSAREIWARMPLWVDVARVTCRVGDKTAQPDLFGRYLRFEHVRAGQAVTIEFPVEERTEHWAAPPQGPPFLMELPRAGTPFTMKFKGNTLVELSPPLGPGSWLYQERPALYRAKKAPMKEVERYVTPFQLRW